MRCFTLASAVGLATASVTAPPRIELDLKEVRVYELATKITRDHDLGFTQPGGAVVKSRQDYSARCMAGESTITTCPLPYARAYDHQESDVDVHTRLFLVDTQPINGAAVTSYTRVTSVDFSQRSTYLFRYDAVDGSGNHAEQIVFALVLDDTKKPTIQMCGDDAEQWEAASTSALCQFSSAYDNIDGLITDRITYTVTQISSADGTVVPATLGTAVSLSAATALVTTNHIHSDFVVVLEVEDNAGKYGANHVNNKETDTKAIKVKDTVAPWFKLHGAEPHVHECAETYTDAGATVSDALDTVMRSPATITPTVTMTVAAATVGDYTVEYDATDAAGHSAITRTRRVQVRDTKDPTINLVGLSEVVHYAGASFTDDGSICNDACWAQDTLTTTFTWSRPFDTQVLGDYLRTYCCTDTSQNEACIVRKFTVVDNTAPMLHIVGDTIATLEATRVDEYTDAGATCEDYVDGTLSHAVEVSGNVVNMRIPGKYVIRYDCQDLSGNQAEPLNRTVYIKDETCPRISLLGVGVIYLESGFDYKDAGATATDDLDGDITPLIQKVGDTVDTSANFFMRQSCLDIKQGANAPLDGEYYINVAGTRTLVECDFTGGDKTYFVVNSATRVVPYSTAQGSCPDYNMQMMQFATAAEKTAARVRFGAEVVPVSGDTDTYLCTTDKVSDSNNYKHWVADEGDQTSHAYAGKYVIEYHVKDRAQNAECAIIRRTVIVKDLIPQVITSHLRNAIVAAGAANTADTIADNNNAGLYGVSPSHKTWPLFKVKEGSWGGSQMMAETTEASTNGWIIGAAASAVTGLALLGFSTRKQAVTSVPV